MRKFLIVNRHRFTFFAAFLACFAAGLALAGCGAPTWLSDASQIIGLVGASFTSIASFVAGLTGNAALAAALAIVSQWVTKVQTGIADLEQLITQYQDAPNSTLLARIEAGLADVKANVAQDFSNLGLPTAVLSVISGIASVALGLLVQWSALFGNVASAATAEEYRVASHSLAQALKNLPLATATYRAQINAILDTKTGDAEADAALAKVARL